MQIAGVSSSASTKNSSASSFQRLNLYQTPPEGEISLEEFERLALERLSGKGFDSLLSVHRSARITD